MTDFMIKCNTGYMQYLYWSGTAWTREITRARRMQNQREAERELAALHPPRPATRSQRPMEVFEL